MNYLKLPLILTILLCFLGRIPAQNIATCGTTIGEQYTTLNFVAQQGGLPLTNLIMSQVPVKFHIIGADNGTQAVDSALVVEELELANQIFAAINLEFIHCGAINYINDSDYLTFTKTVDEDLCDIHDVPNAINIYFAKNLVNTSGGSICGYAYNFDIRNRVFVDNDCADNSSTLIHELGHSFSLLHTHTTANGAELADGSNCANAGDLLCDTPADPRLNNAIVNQNCEYTGAEIDDQGDEYAPNTRNLMSYSRKECRDEFSAEQLSQMEVFFLLEGGFLDCANGPVSTISAEADQLIVYPNPTAGTIFLHGLKAFSFVEVVGVNGTVLDQREPQGDQLGLSVFEELPAGLYFIRLRTASGKIHTRKVVKL